MVLLWIASIVERDDIWGGIEARRARRASTGIGRIKYPRGRRVAVRVVALVEHLRSAGRILQDCQCGALLRNARRAVQPMPATHAPAAGARGSRPHRL